MANYNSSHTGAEIDSAVGRTKDTVVTAGTVAASSAVVVDANKDISGFRNVTLTGQIQAATINLTGDTTIGDGDTDNITINADVNSNIIPNTDNTFDLGSASKQWKDIYVNGIGYIDQLGTDADPIAIYASSGEIDGTAIGSESASTGAFTTLTASGDLTLSQSASASRNIVGDRTDAQFTIKGGSSGAGVQLFGSTYTNYAGALYLDATASSSGTNDAMIIMRTGSSPTEALRIDRSQNSTFAGDLTVPHKIIHDGDTDTYIRYLTDNIVLYTGGAQRLDVNSSRVYITDLVSIGASDPLGYGLNIESSNALRIKGADSSSNYHIRVLDSASNVDFAVRGDGNVGIGTSSPNAPLQFSNDADTRKIVLYEGANNDYQFYGFGIEGSTLVYSTYTTSDDHVFFAGTGVSSRNELMRIGGDGRVSLNETSPLGRLHIEGDTSDYGIITRGPSGYGSISSLVSGKSAGWSVYPVTNGSYTDLQFGAFDAASTGTKVTFASDGNVGIGTTSPSYVVDINSNSATDLNGLRIYNEHGDGGNLGKSSIELSVQNSIGNIPRTRLSSQEQTSDSNFAEFVIQTSNDNSSTLSEVARFSNSSGTRYFRLASGTSGIQFGGETASAHALDDYEEGTWDPIINRITTSPTVSYSSNRYGAFTKVGNMVFATFDVTFNSISGGSGSAILSGLPFTASNDNNKFAGYSVLQQRAAGGVAAGGSGQQLSGFVERNATYLYLQLDNSGTSGYDSVTGASWASSGRFTGYIMYVAA